MGFLTRYDVRVVQDGKVVNRKRFETRDRMGNWLGEHVRRDRRYRISASRVFQLETFQNTVWGPRPHTPWVKAPGPLDTVFVHHSVTAQLPANATIEREKQEMRNLDAIAHGRGFNGISYSWAIFPSGRCWEGRGWLVVEAGTEGHNTTSDSIVLVGNYSSFKPTELQRRAIISLVNRARAAGVLKTAGLEVRGHREVSATSCPGSNVTNAWLLDVERAVNG